MDLKLRSIILWPKNRQNEIRRINFKCEGVEVISGWSEKGKSSIIHIVDYCLGSEKCAIPIGKVREAVEWFGVLLALPRGRQILIARMNPGESQGSTEMMYLDGTSLELPSTPHKTHSRDTVIAELNNLAGLPTRGTTLEEGSDSDGPPSFRDMAAFNFQPQNVIANPNILFFKSELWEHRRKLVRSVLPYVLGAVDAKTLDDQARYRLQEAKLKIKREELELKRKAMESLLAGLRAHFRTAQSYQLIDEDVVPSLDWTPKDYTAKLKEVPARWRRTPFLSSLGSLTRKARAEISALEKSRARLINEIDSLHRQVAKTSRVSDSFDGYSSALKEQSDRVFAAGWLRHQFSETKGCPLCNNPTPSTNYLDQLIEASQSLSESVSAVSAGTPILAAELRKLEQQIEQTEAKLEAINIQLNDWETRSTELKELGSRRDFINSFVGRLESELAAINAGGAAEIEKEILFLEKELHKLLHDINPDQIRQKTEHAIGEISKGISHYANLMKVGHAAQQWSVDDKNLTLVSRKPGRDDYLWEIGSAANWMGYHVATLLSMHEYFRQVPHNPVPKFIVLDQPSQAYFPEGLGRKNGKKLKELALTRSDDVSRLQRLFAALSDCVERTGRGLQIILLEHAEPEMWKGVRHFSLVDGGEWRDHGALVPDSWT